MLLQRKVIRVLQRGTHKLCFGAKSDMGKCSSRPLLVQDDPLVEYFLPDLAELVRSYAYEPPPLRVRSVWKLPGQFYFPKLVTRDGSLVVFMDCATDIANRDSRLVCVEVETGARIWATSVVAHRTLAFTNFVETERGTFLTRHDATVYELERRTGAFLRSIHLPSSETRLFATDKGDPMIFTKHGIVRPLLANSPSLALDVGFLMDTSGAVHLRPEQLGWNYFFWCGLVFFADGIEHSRVVCPQRLGPCKFLSPELCINGTYSKIELLELASVNHETQTRTFAAKRRFDLAMDLPRFYKERCFAQETMRQGVREWMITLVHDTGDVVRLDTGTGQSWCNEKLPSKYFIGVHQVGQRICFVGSKKVRTLEPDNEQILKETKGELTQSYRFGGTLFVWNPQERKWTMIQ